MAIEIKFLIDGIDRGQPLNPQDFGFSIAEDDSIGSRIVSFNNDLFFDGTAYQYLFVLSSLSYSSCFLMK